MSSPHNPTYGQDTGTDDPRIVSLFHETPRYVRPLSPEHCARALNDQEMIEAIEAQLRGELRPARHLDQPLFRRLFGYNIIDRIRTMPGDMADAFQLLIDDVRERPQSHALVALVSFMGTAGLIYGSAWLLVMVLS